MVAGFSIPLLLAVSLGSAPSAQDSTASPPDVRARGILLIASDDSAQVYVREIYEGFRDVLGTATTPTLLFREFFDIVRFGDRPGYAGEFRKWLQQKYRDHPIDVLVTTVPQGLDLIAAAGDGPWSHTPIVYGAIGPDSPDIAAHYPDASSVILEDPFPQFLQLVTSVVPGTRRIAVIRGASVAERARDAPYLAAIERQGLAVQDFGGLSMQTILERVSELRSDTVPILLGFQVDAAGHTFQAGQAVRQIAAAAARPVFSVNPADIGSGAAGGVLSGTRMAGEELAKAALARLAGAGPQRIAIPASRHMSAVFDARELERWGIAEKRLPAGSTVLYREPSLWRDYRRTVVAALVVGSTQTLLIVAILVQRRHRARIQTALSRSYGQLRDLTGRLITAQEEERARIARNLHDDIGQRVASLSIALSGAKRMASSDPLRAELVTMQQVATSLSGELRDLSHDLHPGILEHVGLIEALRARCDELAHTSGANCRLDVSDDWRDVADSIALCLYRVAQEALRNIEKHAGADNVVVSLDQRNGSISMQVIDDGQGFATDQKKQGLGLLSLNERVSLLGGVFHVTSRAGAGTTLAVTLPMSVSHAA
jgi:signal transduction histidine kinase